MSFFMKSSVVSVAVYFLIALTSAENEGNGGDSLRSLTFNSFSAQRREILINRDQEIESSEWIDLIPADLFDDLSSPSKNGAEELFTDLQSPQCKCKKRNCGCCANLKLPVIHLKEKVCANVTYDPKQLGVGVMLQVDGHVILNGTISLRNPSAICVPVPKVKAASVCVAIYDIKPSPSGLKACLEVTFSYKKVVPIKKSIKLGCFTIPV